MKFQLNEILPNFLTHQINESLSHLKIGKSDIDATWEKVKTNPCFVRYKSINGLLAVSVHQKIMNDRRYILITQALQKIGPLPNLDFIVCLEDSINENIYPCPIFTFATKKPGTNLILMPDPTALDPKDRAYITKEIVKRGKIQYPWHNKKEIVFWRGSPTGPAPTEKEILKNAWEKAPRFHLVRLSKSHPQTIDAGFITNPSVNPALVSWPYTSIGVENGPLLASKLEIVKPVHPRTHLQYKYLIDVDGHSCCYSRTYWVLLSNSVMLKQVTDHCQWFYKGIEPFVHFVPVEENLKDLFEKMTWCQANDQKMEEIAERSTEFALNYLQYESNLLFLRELLKEYASHMRFEPRLEKGDLTRSLIPLYGQVFHTVKGFLRKKMNKPIA